MDTMTSRISKIVTGSFIMSLTLFSGGEPMSYEMLYSLIALPIIFSGMYDWRPVEMILAWIARSLHIKPDDITLTPKGV